MPGKWRYMLWGGVGAGKTSLVRALHGGLPVKKTQMIEFTGSAIDTPGEYSEMGRLTRHLLSTSADANLIVVVHDATQDRTNFSPNYFRMFNLPVIGIVTKIDLPLADRARAERILREIGVTDEVFFVSVVNGEGLDQLRQSLKERSSNYG